MTQLSAGIAHRNQIGVFPFALSSIVDTWDNDEVAGRLHQGWPDIAWPENEKRNGA